MKLSSDDLRQHYQRQTARPAAERDQCPPAETLARAAAGELEETERDLVVRHIGACSNCAVEVRIAGALAPWAREAEAVSSPPRRWPAWAGLAPHSRAAVVALAATLVVAIGAPLAVWLGSRAPAVDRGVSVPAAAVDPADRAVLPAPPAVLSWQPTPSASSYQVVLFDEEATPVWESPPLAATGVVLPPEVRDRLGRERVVYWRVVSVVGVERRQSDLYSFEVARK